LVIGAASAIAVQRTRIFPDSVGATFDDLNWAELPLIGKGYCTRIYADAVAFRSAGW